MIPYVQLGAFELPTYGIMMAAGLLTAAIILSADLTRRGLRADAIVVTTIAGLAGLAGSRIYHLLERPEHLTWADLFGASGYAWLGGMIAGGAALVGLARFYKTALLDLLDAACPAAAAGYALGRIGCLLSGDGDYGVPTNLPWGMSFPNGLVPTLERVHPTPIYEFLAGVAIAVLLWRMGAPGRDRPLRKGQVFAAYLILSGSARFLVEFIRINPRSAPFDLTNAQVGSLASIALGAAVLWFARSRARPQHGDSSLAQ